MHLPQSSNLEMPVGLDAQDAHGSGCQGHVVVFTATLTDRVVLPNDVLYLPKNVSWENSHREPHNLAALLQL